MLRWRIAILVSAAIAISYLDRQTLPVAVQRDREEISHFPISSSRLCNRRSCFPMRYVRWAEESWSTLSAHAIGFAVIMTFWSLANASHALATSFAHADGEPVSARDGRRRRLSAATRAVAEWFPTKERATAMGIINAGTAVGAVIAPPLIALVLAYSGWRWIFVITGGLGLALDVVVDLSHIFRRRIIPR